MKLQRVWDTQSKIHELELKINQNKMYRDKAMQIRRIIQDRNAQMQCDTEIKEYQKYIDYFSDEIRKLRQKPSRSSTQSTDSTFDMASTGSATSKEPGSSPIITNVGMNVGTAKADGSEPEKRKYSNLDLLKADTKYNKAKVSLKLHELEYKLDVEKKVMAGIKNMAGAFDKNPSSVDRRRRADVQNELSESVEKLNLLNKAVRKYKNLYLGEGDDEDEIESVMALRSVPGLRKPLTGKLQVQILEVRELAHAPTRTFSMPETVAVVKVDGNVVFRTRPSRSDKWADQCEVNVSKASDVEFCIYDQSGERSMPIGILWLKISDIVDGLRRQKIMQDNGQGWVPAEIAQQHDSTGGQSPRLSNNRQPTYREQTSAAGGSEGIEAWFDVEPVGHIALRINFVRDAAAGGRRPLDKLGRAGAVRQRKEEVHEMNGHQFVEKSFFNIMRCALCGEFMVNSGYQCEDCEYSCHRKCYTKVVTKCISRTDTEADADEDKINHRIPHRFEPITNIGANWCCHCGYMLPLGSRGSKKCHECGISCHSKCAHLVPDFCGMSMEMANQMLAEIKAAKRRTNEGGTPKPQKAERPTSGGSTASLGDRTDSLPTAISQLSLQGGHQQQSHSHAQYPQQYSPSSMHMPPPMPPQGQQQMQYPQARPQPPPQGVAGNYNMSQPVPQGMPQGYGYPNMGPPHMRQPMNPPPMQQQMNTPPMQRVPSPARPQSYAPVPNTAMMPRPYPGSPSPYQPAPSPQMGQHIQQRPHPAAPRVSSNEMILYRVS
ncbi:hypothetical protein INT43_006565 [Umbelopsis isabellina]|uniref:Protein kinase C n=1 Tax=Mortierella isabellina TaxID=91625 RepID=A0A8H7Q1X8_MORIS|nr:hypothetical protein INT43_006565 [Umbelopsis isabellina]